MNVSWKKKNIYNTRNKQIPNLPPAQSKIHEQFFKQRN